MDHAQHGQARGGGSDGVLLVLLALENRDLCSEEDLKSMDSYIAMSAEARAELIESKDSAMKNAEKTLDDLLKSLQSQFEQGKKDKEEAIAAATPGLSMLKMVQRGASGDSKEEL